LSVDQPSGIMTELSMWKMRRFGIGFYELLNMPVSRCLHVLVLLKLRVNLNNSDSHLRSSVEVPMACEVQIKQPNPSIEMTVLPIQPLSGGRGSISQHPIKNQAVQSLGGQWIFLASQMRQYTVASLSVVGTRFSQPSSTQSVSRSVKIFRRSAIFVESSAS